MGQWQKDATNRQILGISSLPSGTSVLVVTLTIAANSTWNLRILVTPDNSRLSDWNFATSIVIDDNTTIDSTGLLANIFPNGSGLRLAVQNNTRRSAWLDYIQSDDQTNMRAYLLRIENNDSASHTYYVYFKAYTQSSNPSTHS